MRAAAGWKRPEAEELKPPASLVGTACAAIPKPILTERNLDRIPASGCSTQFG